MIAVGEIQNGGTATNDRGARFRDGGTAANDGGARFRDGGTATNDGGGEIEDGGTATNDRGARLRHSWRNWSESYCLCGLQFAFHTPRIYNRDHFQSRRGCGDLKLPC